MAVVVFLLTILSATVLEAHRKDTDTFNEKPGYHLTMLKRSVDQMKRSWVIPGKSHVVKRSTKAKADDLFLKSVASYCENFQSDPDITRYLHKDDELQPLSARDITGYIRLKSKTDRQHIKEPNVFPVKVHAQREGDQVWIVFEIAHFEPAIVSRFDSIDFQKTVLEKPDDSCSKIVSKARFMVKAPNAVSKYSDKGKNYADVSFQVTSALENSPYTISAFLDVWKFDKKWNYDRRRYLPSESVTTKNITIPSLLLFPDPGDVIFVKAGEDVTIKLNAYSVIFHLSLVLWDWNNNKIIRSSARIVAGSHPMTKIEYDTVPDGDEELFTVAHNGSMGYATIVIKTASGYRSGLLHLTVKDSYSSYSSSVIRQIAVERTIQIKVQHTHQIFPPDLIYFSPKERFQCNIHCSVRCQAFGSDISSLYITKLEPTRRRVKSASYTYPGNTITILDVGQPTFGIEGEYQCIAVDSQGQTTTQDLKLYTSLSTEVRYFVLRYNDSETACLTCIAHGPRDTNISISVNEDGQNYTRLDTQDKYEKMVDYEDGQITLTMTVPWKDLKVPATLLKCDAWGDRGANHSTLRLQNYYQNYFDIYPDITLKRTHNGLHGSNMQFNITCTVTGKQPIHIEWFLYNKPSKTETPTLSLKHATQTDGNRTISTLFHVPSSGIYDAVCKARNKYKEVSERYSLL